MPDEYVISVMRGQRADLCEQLQRSDLTKEEAAQIIADIKEVDGKLEQLGVDNLDGEFMDGAAFDRAEMLVQSGRLR